LHKPNKMRESILLIIAITGLLSCRQDRKSSADAVTTDVEKTEAPKRTEAQKQPSYYNNKYLDAQYEFSDSTGKRIRIQNSLPKGGLKYMAPNGEEFVYAIFWTHITNETDNPLKLTINFSAESFELPSLSDTYFNIFLPPDAMTPDKESMFNYGLKDLASFLDNRIHKASVLQKTIDSQDVHTFYVVTLFNQGLQGTVRAGLSIKGQNLFYKINDKEIHCGKINFK